MRKNTDDDDDALIEALAKMPEERQEAFKYLVRVIGKALLEDEAIEGVTLLRVKENMLIIPINADEMLTAELLHQGVDHMYEIVMHDAPKKNAFN